MSAPLFALFFIFLIFAIFIGGIFLIAYLAAQSRKRKQTKLLEMLPTDAEFHAFVRYNRNKQQSEFFKVKAFEGSGVIYIGQGTVSFRSTLGMEHDFDLHTSKVRWEGENLVNGLLKWFSIEDEQTKMFFNVESGMFIFQTSADKPTTKSIFDRILLKQASLK